MKENNPVSVVAAREAYLNRHIRELCPLANNAENESPMTEEFKNSYVAYSSLIGDAKCCVALMELGEPSVAARQLIETTKRHIEEAERAQDALINALTSQP